MEPLHVGILILVIVAVVALIVIVARRTRKEPRPEPDEGPPPELEEGPPPAEVKPKPEVEVKPKPEVEVKPKPEVEVKPKPEVEVKPKPEVEVKPKPEVEVKPKPEVEVKPKPEVEVKPKPRVEVKPKPRVEVKPEPPVEPEKPRETGKERIKKIRRGLKATRGGFISRLKSLFKGKAEMESDLNERIEEVFITSDVGASTAQVFIDRIQDSLSAEEMTDLRKVWGFIRAEALRILSVPEERQAEPQDGPYTILVLGVNGVGKTTTIGKLACMYSDQGKKVLLGAADTFRAAAVEQLEVWGKRIDVPVVRGMDGADPSSVVFDALKRARAEGHDVVIVDTAGRLHTKIPLMEELKKLRRVMGKAQPGAPHEVLLVLDATTGQNGIMQARTFLESLEVTSIALTKLDGTAKGGVILGIASELHIPVRYIGVGEGITDLRPFDPDEFIEALFDEIDEGEAAA